MPAQQRIGEPHERCFERLAFGVLASVPLEGKPHAFDGMDHKQIADFHALGHDRVYASIVILNLAVEVPPR